MLRRSRPAPVVVAVISAIAFAAPAAAQSPAPTDRQAAEEALESAQQLADGRGIRTGREVTTALLNVARLRSALARSERAEADSLLGRPTDSGDVDQPAGPYTVAEQP